MLVSQVLKEFLQRETKRAPRFGVNMRAVSYISVSSSVIYIASTCQFNPVALLHLSSWHLFSANIN